MSWKRFEASSPEFASAARRLFIGDDGVAIAFLATVSLDAGPHLAPVCPIFCEADLYLCTAAASPKAVDLRVGSAYVLHAFLAAHDEEFQIAGSAEAVLDETERAAVHEAIRFAAFNRDDPIFRLSIDRALWVYWERVGQPDTAPVRRRWKRSVG